MSSWITALISVGGFTGLALIIRQAIRWRRETRVQEAVDYFLSAETKEDREDALRLLRELNGSTATPPVEPSKHELPGSPKDPPMAGSST
jgi:hypothetical protein